MTSDVPEVPDSPQLLDERVSALSEKATELSEVVASLNTTLGKVSKAGERNKRRIRWTTLAVIVDIALTVAVGVLWNNQSRVNHEIQTGTDQALAVQTHIVGVLCPLYRLFLDSYDPKVRDAMTPTGQQHYDQQYGIIGTGYRNLGCVAISGAPMVTPSATASATASPTP